MIAFPLYLQVLFFSSSGRPFWQKTLKTQSKIGSGLSLTWLVWFCCKSKITILKVDKVSRNPVDHIMNVACLEIKSHKWFKDDTKKMASLHELCSWWKWEENKKATESPFTWPMPQFTKLGRFREGKGGETKSNPQIRGAVGIGPPQRTR